MQIQIGINLIISCEACGRQCPHNVFFAKDPIHHLRCSACGAANAFVLESSEGDEKGVKEMRTIPLDHAALMERRGSQELHTYSTTRAYSDGQYFMHPEFGEGYILALLLSPVTMEVLFKDQKRVIVWGSGSIVGGARQGQEGEPSQEKKVRPEKFSRADQAKRDSEPLPREKAARSSGSIPCKCPVCGSVVHPFNLAQDPSGRIVGCMRCC